MYNFLRRMFVFLCSILVFDVAQAGEIKTVNVLAVAALPLTVPVASPANEVVQQPLPSLADMLERINPAVVNIATRSTVREANRLLQDPFFQRFFNLPESRRRYRRTQSAGSGVVVDAANGYIVTNNHVIQNADEISVGLADGRILQAQLVGRDAQVDLALLQVEAKGLTAIQYADSGAVRVGDFVVAIGNPFGLNQTVTSGIVSALGRSGLGIEGFEDFIQTDAPINPGNSGGALVDLRGDLVGINTAIFAPAGGNVGIGFAIPANMVNAVLAQLISKGEVNRGFVGAIVQPLNRELAGAFGVLSDGGRPKGVVVVDVELASSAEKAGLEPGDVITSIEGKQIETVADFAGQAAIMFIGDRLAVDIIRRGEAKSITLQILADDQEQVNGQRLTSRLRGVVLQNLPNVGEQNKGSGVLVIEVEPGTPAFSFGLRGGDIIVAANQRPIENISKLREAVRAEKRLLLLRVYRNGQFGDVIMR
jgi:serine protease Do/serine protease DegQ